MSTAIAGKCFGMCPTKERLMREREGLLHKFERSEDQSSTITKNTRGSYTRATKTVYKGDVAKVVKMFARSAAGLDKTMPCDLRPADVLERTVEYLYSKILTLQNEPFTTVYDFIFDRLRAVRQDLVIQRISNVPAIRILESMVRFHIYSAYRCRHESLSNFDPQINRKHLIDNLKRLISLYELNSYWNSTRIEFESFYLILCPDSPEVLRRALALRQHQQFKHDKFYQLSTQLILSYQSKNFVKYFKILKLVPSLMCAAALENSTKLRRIAFQVLAKAYGSSTCRFPLTVLQLFLLYPNLRAVEKDLKILSVQIVQDSMNNQFAAFVKSSIFTSIQLDAISCDLEPLCSSDSIMEPIQVNTAAKLICPQLTPESVPPTKGHVVQIQDYWFSD